MQPPQNRATILDLPDKAILNIFGSFRCGSARGVLTACNPGGQDTFDVDATAERLCSKSLAACCKRFYTLYRENVCRVVYEYAYSSVVSSRVLKRFPAVCFVELDFLCVPNGTDLEPCVSSVFKGSANFRTVRIRRASMDIRLLRDMVETCSTLQELQLSRVDLLLDKPSDCYKKEACTLSLLCQQDSLDTLVLDRVTTGVRCSPEKFLDLRWFTFEQLPMLQVLELNRLSGSSETFESIGALVGLQNLELRDVNITVNSLERLLPRLDGLRQLTLDSIDVSDRALLTLPASLFSLSIHGCQAFTYIRGIPAASYFTEFAAASLVKLSVTNFMCDVFHLFLPRAANVEEVYFKPCPANYYSNHDGHLRFLSLLKFISKSRRLMRLEIRACSLPASWSKQTLFMALSQVESLKELSLALPSYSKSIWSWDKQFEQLVKDKSCAQPNSLGELINLLSSGPLRHSLRRFDLRIAHNEETVTTNGKKRTVSWLKNNHDFSLVYSYLCKLIETKFDVCKMNILVC